MFAILFEVLLIEIQEEIHHFVGWEGGGSRGTKIVNKTFVNKLAFPTFGIHAHSYPSVSALAGGNSDHGPRKTRTKTQTTPDSVFIGERRNSDHGLSFWGWKTQTMV